MSDNFGDENLEKNFKKNLGPKPDNHGKNSKISPKNSTQNLTAKNPPQNSQKNSDKNLNKNAKNSNKNSQKIPPKNSTQNLTTQKPQTAKIPAPKIINSTKNHAQNLSPKTALNDKNSPKNPTTKNFAPQTTLNQIDKTQNQTTPNAQNPKSNATKSTPNAKNSTKNLPKSQNGQKLTPTKHHQNQTNPPKFKTQNLPKISLKSAKISAQNLAQILSDKELMHFAASLSFHTLLSLIPVLLISFSIFTQMPSFAKYYAKIKEFIFSNLLPSNSDQFVGYLDGFLANSSSLGIVGLVGVIVTSIMFFGDYEFVISKITKTPTRGFWRGLSVYWTMITLMPLGLGLSFFLSGHIQHFLSQNDLTAGINFLSIFPFLIIWAIFGVTYLITINQNIPVKTAILASFITSLVWSLSKWAFIKYAFYNKSYTNIYGSFSILLLFFLWIYLSWIIFLYGVKLCRILGPKS